MRKFTGSLVLPLVLAAGFLTYSTAAMAETVTLRMTNWLPPVHHLYKSLSA